MAGHHLPALGLVARGAEEDADADIEAVEDHVEQDRGGDDPRPEQGERAWLHRRHPFALGWLPVALAAVSAKASGRLAVAFGIASAAADRPLPEQLVDVEGAEADEDGIDQHVAGERERARRRWSATASPHRGCAGGRRRPRAGGRPRRCTSRSGSRRTRSGTTGTCPRGTSASSPAARASAGSFRAKRRRA